MDKTLYRIVEIDYLRGFAMVAIILIHTTVFYVSNPVAFFFWNYSQWAVPAFLFCSGYLYFRSPPPLQWRTFVGFLKKRFLRLVIPYYVFLPIYLFFIRLISPSILTKQYILQSLLLTGGIQINWLVLLFLQCAVLMPILAWLFQKQRFLFWCYTFLAVGSACLFLLWQVPFDWRTIMWLPWSTVLLFALFYGKKFSVKWSAGIALVFFLVSVFILHFSRHSLHFYDNKYPPNMLIISFGIGVISLWYLVHDFLLFLFSPLKTLLVFLSRYSYSLYFLHYVILLLTQWVERLRHVWFMVFFLVFTLTVLMQKFLLLLWHKRQ